MKTVSVGVDVDSLHHYYRIHGLDDASASNAAWTVGVPRFLELFAELGVPATFYCVAEDLDLEENRQWLQAMVAAGHEIGNHSWRHPYDLTRLDAETRKAEVAEGRRRLEEAAGVLVTGFRSPGYNTTPELALDVRATGHRYDSSVFPCVPYYSAKAAVMGLMALRGRRSRSVLGDPKVLLSPRVPYVMHPEEPHRRGVGGLVQCPISVFGGVPLIGTAFTAMGRMSDAVVAAADVGGPEHLTLEFHAVDLLGLRDDGLDPALAVQPDLKVSVRKKRNLFYRVLKSLKRRRQYQRLDMLAEGWAWSVGDVS
ncbi:MAG: polysaccharide deacetylase family protein [Bradymonadia bacterium]